MTTWCARRRNAVGVESVNRTELSSVAESIPSSMSTSQLGHDLLYIQKYTRFFPKGCIENPVTSRGKPVQCLHLLTTVMVPVLALMVMVGTIFVTQIQGYHSSQDVRSSIHFCISVSDLINVLQRERDMSAFYVSVIGSETKVNLLKAYVETDYALDKLPYWIIASEERRDLGTKEMFITFLNHHRYNLDLNKPMPQSELNFYTHLMSSFMSWFYSAITAARSGTVWKELVATQELLAASNSFGIERAMGSIFYSRGGFADMDEYRKYSEGYDCGMAAVRAAMQFSIILVTHFNESLLNLHFDQGLLYAMRKEITQQGGDLIGVNKSLAKATNYFEAMSALMDVYLKMEKFLIQKIELKLLSSVRDETYTIILLGTLFGIVMMICPLIVKSVHNLTNSLQSYPVKIGARTTDIITEKKRIDLLRYQFVPTSVAERIKKNEFIKAEEFAEVTVLHSNIVGFISVLLHSSPCEVIAMLNSLNQCFDTELLKYDVYKLETLSDGYIVASGVPHRNDGQHAVDIACLALDLMERVADLTIPHMPGKIFRMRIGLSTGSVVAVVLGKRIPRYCLFGRTITAATLLEKSSNPGRIHISELTYTVLTTTGSFVMIDRKSRIKDLDMSTYWLLYRIGQAKSATAKTETKQSFDSFSLIYADEVDALIAQGTQIDEGNVVMSHHCSPDECSEEDS